MDKLRRDRGLSIFALAKKAGVSQATIYKWRDQESAPSLYLLESICTALGTDILNLFIRDDELVYLTEKDKDLIGLWKALMENQRSAILELIKTMLKENQKLPG